MKDLNNFGKTFVLWHWTWRIKRHWFVKVTHDMPMQAHVQLQPIRILGATILAPRLGLFTPGKQSVTIVQETR